MCQHRADSVKYRGLESNGTSAQGGLWTLVDRIWLFSSNKCHIDEWLDLSNISVKQSELRPGIPISILDVIEE